MAKRPAMMFYPADWLTDPQLGMCSPAARGIWMDILCLMHKNSESGKLEGTINQLSRPCRCTPDELADALAELAESGAANVTPALRVTNYNAKVTVMSRRMVRDLESRKSSADRQKRFRGTRVTPTVTPESRGSNIASSSSSSSSSSKETKKPSTSVDWERVAFLWNRYRHVGLPTIHTIADKRKKKYNARLKAFPDFWQVLDRELVRLSDFAKEGSWLTFDWCITSDGNFTKLAEGNYRAKPGSGGNGQAPTGPANLEGRIVELRGGPGDGARGEVNKHQGDQITFYDQDKIIHRVHVDEVEIVNDD